MDLPTLTIAIMHFDLSAVVLRIIHILGGTLWAGLLWYQVLFVLPGVESLAQGADGWVQSVPPRLFQLMNMAAIVVLLSGVFLLWEISGGLSTRWMTTPRGIVLTTAGAVGMLSALQGWLFARAASMHMEQLCRAGAGHRGSRPEIGPLAGKVVRAMYRTAYLVALALIGMAASRYID